MRTRQREDTQHWRGDRGSGCCGGSGRRDHVGCGPHGYTEDTSMDRRHALEEHQRDLEQQLADVAEQLRDLPTDEPRTSE